ncbi:MAG TPA: YceI family protein [Gaiellales bacterium]|jgi:polyisoprenoid-binding protein YceI|nr:YceI family protein [Gaiellales bacterium]
MSSTVATEIPTGTWSIDPVHSSIGFGVKHFGVSTFRGSFSAAAGSLVTDNGAVRSVEGTVRIENLVTEDSQLTGHLHSEDFFDAASHPEISFKSTSVEQLGGDKLRINGDLQIRGITRPIELDAEIEGAGDDPYGNTRLGVTATGAVDRTDWGITWNAPPLANGSLAVGERVAITVHVEAVRQA